jgi:hypothetical protein
VIDQLEVRLVDDFRRAQRVVAALALKLAVRDAPQLVVDERQQAVEGVAVAPLEHLEEAGDPVLLHPRLHGGHRRR